MLIYMNGDSTEEQIRRVKEEVISAGFSKTFVHRGDEVVVVNCIGSVSHEKKLALQEYFESLPGVTGAELAKTPFRLTARASHPEQFVVPINGVSIGENQPVIVIAGPCAVESEDQLVTCARLVKAAGAKLLRGGAYKPRKSPHSFQGLEEDGLKILATARQEIGLPVVTEIITPDLVDLVAKYADVLQIGTANMQNYRLLEAVGRIGKPVILKRGMAAKIDEWLLAAEYIVNAGNDRVILCARGVRGIESGYTRFNADQDAIPVVKGLTHHPVIFDPSHTSGKRELVIPNGLAAIAAGADGLLVEVHPCPQEAKCDGEQALHPEQFVELMAKARKAAAIYDRTI